MKYVLSVFILAGLLSSRSQSLQCTPCTRESSLTQLSFIMEIKLCVSSVGVHLESTVLSYSDDVGCVQNKEQRSKDASLWYAYATENR